MRIDWKAYFTFSKKDRVAAVIMLILIVLIASIVLLYNPSNYPSSIAITTLDQELAQQGIDTSAAVDEQRVYLPSEESEVANSNTGELFQFDPNTLDAAGFKRLGLQDKTINTIIKYRSKGGHFWKADDIRKIYSLHKEDADRLVPYIQITGQHSTFTQTDKAPISYATTPGTIDINTATAEQWKALPAIGYALANRIVKFRNKIGGFTSITQVKQTYGISDSAFKLIAPYLKMAAIPEKAVAPEKLNINTASLNQLKNNSHIPEQVAQAIVIYRSQHGNFSTVADVKKIVFINDEIYKQIAPYLTVE